MTKTTIGNIRYIEHYVDAPMSAKFILRKLGDKSLVLERYYGAINSKEIKKFSYDADSKDAFHDTLIECRKAIGSRERIWVEKPEWMYEYAEDEFEFEDEEM